MISYAQNFEDVLLWRALGDRTEGMYIDIGAQHPVVDSVSKAFYEHGWRGIHVEPTPVYAELLRQDRPDEHVIEAAVSTQAGLLRFFDIPDTGLSTASPEIAKHHRAQGWAVREIVVTAITLDDVFGLIPDGAVHWLKIDVEGFERQVLEGWRAPVLPWVIVVESTFPNTQTETHANWEWMLFEKGYSLGICDGLNRYYLSPEHAELIDKFQFGPNVFDGFQLAEGSWAVAGVRQRLEAARQTLEKEKQSAIERIAELEQEVGHQQNALQTNQAEFEDRIKQITVDARDEMQRHVRQLHERERQFTAQLLGLQAQNQDALANAVQSHTHHIAALREQFRLGAARQQSDLHEQQQAQLKRERQFRAQLIELQAQNRHAQIELSQTHAAHEAELKLELNYVRQALEQSRADAKALDTALLARSEAYISQVRADAVTNSQTNERIIAEFHVQENALRAELAQYTAYAHALTLRIEAMQSSWSWRLPKLFRRASRWAAISLPPPTLAQLNTSPKNNASPTSAEHVAAQPNSRSYSIQINPGNEAMPIQHFVELFALEGRDFIKEAYRNMFGREPDAQGMSYYLGRLAMGYGKASIIIQLAASPEFKKNNEIKGLENIIAEEKLARHWLLGMLTRHHRYSRLLRQNIEALNKVERHVGALQQTLQAREYQFAEQLAVINSAKEQIIDKEHKKMIDDTEVDVINRLQI